MLQEQTNHLSFKEIGNKAGYDYRKGPKTSQ